MLAQLEHEYTKKGCHNNIQINRWHTATNKPLAHKTLVYRYQKCCYKSATNPFSQCPIGLMDFNCGNLWFEPRAHLLRVLYLGAP